MSRVALSLEVLVFMSFSIAFEQTSQQHYRCLKVKKVANTKNTLYLTIIE